MSTPYGCQIRLGPGANVTVLGIDYGPLSLVTREDKAIVLKNHGYSAWAGRGCDRKYQPPKLLVYRIISSTRATVRKDAVEILNVEPLVEISMARKKKDRV